MDEQSKEDEEFLAQPFWRQLRAEALAESHRLRREVCDEEGISRP